MSKQRFFTAVTDTDMASLQQSADAGHDVPAPVCPGCGEASLPGKERCGICQMRHEVQADIEAALAPMPPLMPQYSLATLFFSVSWIAICLGSLRLNACLGMLLIFLTMPALLRTLALGARDHEAGVAVSPGKRLAVFFASLGIMLLVLVVSGALLAFSAWVALAAASGPAFPSPLHTGVSIAAMTFGILGSFAAAAGILWCTRWVGA